MSNVLSFSLKVICVDLMPGFGIYSLLFWIVRLLPNECERLIQFDKSVTKLVIYLGVTFGFLFVARLLYYYITSNSELDIAQLKNRLFGPYAFGVWLQPVFWVLITQLLRIRILRVSILYRVIMSLLFIFSFERIVIFTSLFHRDYLPSSWSMISASPNTLLFGLFLKSVEFI